MEMQKMDLFVFGVMAPLTLILAGAALSRSHHLSLAATSASPPAKLLHVAPQAVIGPNTDFLGRADSPYTLVEFADYQCPPCRAVNRDLPRTLALYSGRVRLKFRNFPLSFHMYAETAAVAAEAAREQGKFWPMHDCLMQTDLDEGATVRTARGIGLEMRAFRRACETSAEARVRADLKEATALGLPGTPSFLLCCPDGRVVRLGSLEQLAEFVG